ncbi:MAG TPA: SMP-30/gluconolactonase/LRE family protein [Tepidisphaeraceae bacterium]|nr:SMP-30/gluconolactonase/LRE family protein [Tepidisphaeraceae bacterium]
MNIKSPMKTARLLLISFAVAPLNAEPAKDLPPVSIGRSLDNNVNSPMVAKDAGGTLGSIQRFDPALDALVAADAKVEILVEGLQWAEGPIWYEGGLNFSDVPQNTMYRWTPEKGVHPYLKPSGYTGATPRGGEPGSNGLTLDHQNRLTICQHGDRRVVRLEKDGRLTVLADRYHGMRFNSPNDLCYDAKGNLYFTDPPYGLEGENHDRNKEMDMNGIYMIRSGGEMVRLNSGQIVYADGKTAPLKYPNGVALSPDEKTLYICVSDPDHPVYLKYDVQPDGNIANGKVFFDTAEFFAKKLPGLPDGIKVDVHGDVWATGPGGVFIFSSAGKHLGTIVTGDRTSNINWGDDGSTLYICRNHNVCRIKTLTKGVMAGA